MKKIPTIFVRDFANNPSRVTDEVNIEAKWVFNGEGIATRKVDGTCVLIRAGKLLKRREIREGQTPPPNFEQASDVDSNTGKLMGWTPVGDGPEDRYLREAFADWSQKMKGHPQEFDTFTAEFLGPKSQGNVEKVSSHMFLPHAWNEQYPDCPRYFNELREWLNGKDIEGIVWHHPDGRMAKVKLKDFGLKRVPRVVTPA